MKARITRPGRVARLRPVTVLVVDDEPVSRRTFELHLRALGCQVRSAASATEALEALEAHEDIGLLLTDWMMPGMDGIELCRRARALPRERYLYILMLTSRSEKNDLVEAIEAGADAFLTKPLFAPELQAQIRVALRIIDLEERYHSDLVAAETVQRAMLPTRCPRLAGFDCDWIFDSCSKVAGDMFNVFALDDTHVGMYVLDVSGHGVPAALISVSISRALSPGPGGVVGNGHGIRNPGEVAAELNRRFPLMAESGRFFTLLYGVLDVPRGEFRFVRAGHPMPLLVKDTVIIDERPPSPPLGVYDDIVFREESLALRPGEQVWLYTDGVVEAMDAEGEPFGLERVAEILLEHRDRGIRAASVALRERLGTFRGDLPRHDDVTVVGAGLSQGGAESS
jgi:sigma-B regulation protein RsbU (phosphoserine phosphatase)